MMLHMTMEGSTVTLVRPDGSGVALSVGDSTTAMDLFNRAELSLHPGDAYSYTVTREGSVLKVEDISSFNVQGGDELAVTSQNRAG